MTRKTLPTTMPVVLNVVMIISYAWFVVDAIRGLVHHFHDTGGNMSNYPLINAMAFVWLGFGILAHCNSIAINKFNEYLEDKNQSEQ